MARQRAGQTILDRPVVRDGAHSLSCEPVAAASGWIELNEAFAAQAAPILRDLDLDPQLVNPPGGAIAWGHPIGATGAIISARTIENLRVTGRELGLATMCIGGGQAVASLWRAL